MKKTLVLQLLLLFLWNNCAHAQQNFTGVVEYKTITFGENNGGGQQPEQMTNTYKNGKLLMTAVFKEDNRKEYMLINTLNDSAYRTDFHSMTYEKMPLAGGSEIYPLVKLVRTDSVKTLFGYQCHGYQLMFGSAPSTGYVWVAEDLVGIPIKESYNNPLLKMLGAPYILMGLDMYENNQRVGSFIATSVTKTDNIPDSIFNLTGYSEAIPPEELPAGMPEVNGLTDTAMIVMPPSEQIKKYKKKPVKKNPVKKPAPKKPAVKTNTPATKPKQ